MPDGASQLSERTFAASAALPNRDGEVPVLDRSIAVLAARHIADTIRAIPLFAPAAFILSVILAAVSWGSIPLWALIGWLAVVDLAVAGLVFLRYLPPERRDRWVQHPSADGFVDLIAAAFAMWWSAGAMVFALASVESALIAAVANVAIALIGAATLFAAGGTARIFVSLLLLSAACFLFARPGDGGSLTGGAMLLAVWIGAWLRLASAQREFAALRDAALREAEKVSQLATALDELHQGAIAVDGRGQIIASNGAAAAILEIGVDRMAPGRPILELDPSLPVSWLSEAMRSGSLSDGTEIRTPRGRLVAVRYLRRGEGGFLISLEDVSPRRRRELMNQRRQSVLDQLARGSGLNDVLIQMLADAEAEAPELTFAYHQFTAEPAKLALAACSPAANDRLRQAFADLSTSPLLRDSCERRLRMIAADLARSSLLSLADRAELRQSGFSACWTEPVATESEERAGVLTILARHAGQPDELELELGECLATLAGLAIDRHRLQRLRADKHQAELANTAKSRFLHTMSHELRTPLNAINGFAEAMRAEVFGALGHEKYTEYARDIHVSGRHLLSIIDGVLEFAKIETGEYRLEEKTLNLEELIEDERELAAKQPEAGRVTLEVTKSAPLPLFRGDRRALGQAVRSLLSNALKFTPRGGSVTLGFGRGAEGQLWICVKDTGAGIAADALARVLHPFSKARGPLAAGAGGAGMGLPLAKALVELHGGKLLLESRSGEGTSATLLLPAARCLGFSGEAGG